MKDAVPRQVLIRSVVLFALALGFMFPFGSGKFGSIDVSSVVGVSVAEAQRAKKKRRSLFSILFGRKKAKRKQVKRRSKNIRRSRTKATRKRKNRRSTRRRSSVAAVTAPAVTKVEKSADARNVLVIGDFFARGLAEGLDRAFAPVSGLVVVNKGKSTSGFVRNDIIDWPKRLPELVAEFKPVHIVAMLGSNDRQLLVDQGKKLKKRTPEWDAAYKGRVEQLGAALKATGIDYTWVGLPPVRFKKMNKDFLVFNEMYRKAALSEKGTFVDVWDGFSDAEGAYSRSGPDINGQIVLLRPKGGVNLTKAGRRRLAFYVENLILKKTGTDVSPAGGLLASSVDLGAEYNRPRAAAYDPVRTGKTIVIRLSDPSSDGAEVLAGEEVKLKSLFGERPSGTDTGPAPSATTVGRVDSFAWPPSGGELVPSTSQTASN